MEDYIIARVIHVLAVVLWIGGVSMVTSVIIPSVKRMPGKENKIETFEKIEGRFSLQAKITTLLTAVSGFYMLYVTDTWSRYLDFSYWWLHAMTLVWVLFTLVLFIFEPLILRKWFREYAEKHPDKTFDIIHKFHWVLLTFSLITIAGAVAGSHGWFF